MKSFYKSLVNRRGFLLFQERVIRLAKMQSLIIAELDPSKPVIEVCAVIDAVVRHNVIHEEEILLGIKEAIDKRLAKMKGGETDGKPVRGNNGK